jgi:hypothetical protein
MAACGYKQTAIEKAPRRKRFYTRRFFSSLLEAMHPGKIPGLSAL